MNTAIFDACHRMIPVFIGWDLKETVAWHVLANTLICHSTVPLAITPIGNDTLPRKTWWRKRGPRDSTDFSNARFAVPALMNYRGWAIYMDCDMICRGDIKEVWEQRDERYSVQVVKHNHIPLESTKFFGSEQTPYLRKNWSSFQLINCAHPSTAKLIPEYINNAPGLDLHRFAWCWDEEIGSIKGLWNVLLTDRMEHPEPIVPEEVRLLHYTVGGAWQGYSHGAAIWQRGLDQMLRGNNPCADLVISFGNGLSYAGCYKDRNETQTNRKSSAAQGN